MGNRYVIGVLFLAACAPPLLEAQSPDAPAPAPGTRVRVTAFHESRPLVGRLVEATDAVLNLDTGGRRGVVSLRRGDVARIEVSAGKGGRGRGAARGALAGVLIGAAAGYATGEDCTSTAWLCFDRGTMAAVGVGLLTPIGAVVGVFAAGGERWEPVAVGSARLSVRPVLGPSGGVGLRLGLAF